MGYPGYSLADSSPPEIVIFPKPERPGSSLLGRRGPRARERTNLEHETEEGMLWIYAQCDRGIWRLTFRVTETEVEIFETLDLAVGGNRKSFYFYPDSDDTETKYLVRKVKDFDPPALDTPTVGDDDFPEAVFDYVLEMREESEAAQILA